MAHSRWASPRSSGHLPRVVPRQRQRQRGVPRDVPTLLRRRWRRLQQRLVHGGHSGNDDLSEVLDLRSEGGRVGTSARPPSRPQGTRSSRLAPRKASLRPPPLHLRRLPRGILSGFSRTIPPRWQLSEQTTRRPPSRSSPHSEQCDGTASPRSARFPQPRLRLREHQLSVAPVVRTARARAAPRDPPHTGADRGTADGAPPNRTPLGDPPTHARGQAHTRRRHSHGRPRRERRRNQCFPAHRERSHPVEREMLTAGSKFKNPC